MMMLVIMMLLLLIMMIVMKEIHTGMINYYGKDCKVDTEIYPGSI